MASEAVNQSESLYNVAERLRAIAAEVCGSVHMRIIDEAATVERLAKEQRQAPSYGLPMKPRGRK